MKVSPGFREFVLDQLSGLTGLRPQAMFGGVGLYAGEIFFGILAADRLFLKVDDTNRAEYTRAGSRPFKPYADRATVMSYYAVPTAVLENPVLLHQWAGRAVTVARNAGRVRRTSTRKPRKTV